MIKLFNFVVTFEFGDICMKVIDLILIYSYSLPWPRTYTRNLRLNCLYGE